MTDKEIITELSDMLATYETPWEDIEQPMKTHVAIGYLKFMLEVANTPEYNYYHEQVNDWFTQNIVSANPEVQKIVIEELLKD